MKQLSTIILLLGIFMSTATSQEASKSTLKLEYMNGYWVVSVKAQNTMATKALKTNDANLDLSKIEVKDYHDYYQNYLTGRIKLTIDSVQQPLSFVSLEMNSANANGQFISERRENPGNVLSIKSNAFESLGNHITKLIVIIDDQKHVKWLTGDTDYFAEVTLDK